MRHVRSATHFLLVASAVLTVSTATGVALAATDGPSARTATQTVVAPAPAARLVEVPVCWGTTATGDSPITLPSTDGAMVQTIVVSIEPTSLLRLDDDGRVMAAATNTGCAPRATDHLFVAEADGSLRDATGFDLDGVAWTGDFTQYGFVPQG